MWDLSSLTTDWTRVLSVLQADSATRPPRKSPPVPFNKIIITSGHGCSLGQEKSSWKEFHAAENSDLLMTKKELFIFPECEDLKVWDFCLSSTAAWHVSVGWPSSSATAFALVPPDLASHPPISFWQRGRHFSLLFREGLFLVSSKRNLRRPTVWASPAGTVHSRWV